MYMYTVRSLFRYRLHCIGNTAYSFLLMHLRDLLEPHRTALFILSILRTAHYYIVSSSILLPSFFPNSFSQPRTSTHRYVYSTCTSLRYRCIYVFRGRSPILYPSSIRHIAKLRLALCRTRLVFIASSHNAWDAHRVVYLS